MAKKNRPKYEPDYGEAEPVRETNPLRIPEILIRVLEFTGPKAKAIAACVSCRWSKPALEMLWRDLTDLAPYLKIFALLKKVRNSRMSPAEKLERIKSYGALVRSLRFDAFNSSIHEAGTAEVYRALCAGKLDQYLPTVSFPVPSSALFPNLHTLEWRANESRTVPETTLETVSYFLHPSLKHIYVSGLFGQPINLDYPYRPNNVNYVPFFHTLNSMEGLRLESLDLRIGKHTRVVARADEVTIFLSRQRETLVHFSTWTHEFARHLQKEIWGLSRLRSLEVITENMAQASGFIEGLASEVPEMEVLNLKVDPSTREPNQWQRLWDALKRLRMLTKLHLEVPEIEELKEGDARSMKEAWPALSSLYIVLKLEGWRRNLSGTSHLRLSFEFLTAIARHFSQSLTTLGLCLGPSIHSTLPISPVRFEKLQLLYLQPSFAPDDPEDVAQYFVQILPPGAIFTGDWHYKWEQVVHIIERERAKANHP